MSIRLKGAVIAEAVGAIVSEIYNYVEDTKAKLKKYK